jgi:hypothetical protein
LPARAARLTVSLQKLAGFTHPKILVRAVGRVERSATRRFRAGGAMAGFTRPTSWLHVGPGRQVAIGHCILTNSKNFTTKDTKAAQRTRRAIFILRALRETLVAFVVSGFLYQPLPMLVMTPIAKGA